MKISGKGITGLIGSLIFIIGGIAIMFIWGFCRFYVGPNEMAIITAKVGESLEPGQILAKPGQKGIQEEPLGEGRHFRFPLFYEWEIEEVIIIDPGKVGIVTSKVGEKLSTGEFIAERGQKGIWRNVLGPGKYRMNPYGYNVEIVDAISIPIGYAGVITSRSGGQAPSGQFAGNGQKGVRKDVLQPGLYYVNPQAYKVDVLEVGINQVSLLGQDGSKVVTKARQLGQNQALNVLQSNMLEKQEQKRADYFSKRARSFLPPKRGQEVNFAAGKKVKQIAPASLDEGEINLAELVSFPSRDGFEISLDMTLEFELDPGDIAGIYRRYGDLPAVVDKIIMPQITSISRNKGSEYRAKDFIVGEGREKFQDDLTESLELELGEKDIRVYNALIRHVEVPDEIRAPIQQASIAVEQDLTNKERQNTARKEAQLNTELSLIQQRGEQVMQETEKLKAEIAADLQKQVATIQAETLKKEAEVRKATAAINADKVRVLGQAEATALEKVDGEKAKGLQLKTAAFNDSLAYSQWIFADRLNPEMKINIIHAGEGTLWTDLEKTGFAELGGAELLKTGKKQ
ncbi:SPFH domain-containing protein [Pontiella agarivorans]|uniref:SPFH domain-containing protein n=1 Tax=Pontiella agarivorans TaxID=3038953 RepID=A0ABU5MXL0_9BACT|nr:SPFH domain-containing protein [Pontiella agarivorans]MDZ8118873.1 SPFH domain-containing protein [Pontiella agarivorans]